MSGGYLPLGTATAVPVSRSLVCSSTTWQMDQGSVLGEGGIIPSSLPKSKVTVGMGNPREVDGARGDHHGKVFILQKQLLILAAVGTTYRINNKRWYVYR